MDDVAGILQLWHWRHAPRADHAAEPVGPKRTAGWDLWLVGVALFAAGLFPPIPTRPLVAYAHGVSGLVVILASPVVFLLMSRDLAHEPAWSGTSRHLRWATALAWVSMLSFLGFTVAFA